MLTWVTSQSIFVIALIVVTASFLLSAAIIAVVEAGTRRGWAAAFKAASPPTLTPLAVVYGLLTAFVAADVWPNFEHAHNAVGAEAMALREATVLAEALPPNMGTALRDHIRNHIDSVVQEEWPAMRDRRQTLERPAVFNTALLELLSQDVESATQQLARQRALDAVETALDARRKRILLSQATVGPTKITVLLVLACLVLGTTAIVHAENRRAQLITVGMFATASAGALLVILVYDGPFGGGVSVEPTVLIEVRPSSNQLSFGRETLEFWGTRP